MSLDKGPWIKQIRSEDIATRLAFVKNLPTLAASVGPVKFRDEVLNDIKELLEDEDDVLFAIAEELGKEQNFVTFVGDLNFTHLLLSPLESLSRLDDTLIREKAVLALSILGKSIPDNLFEKNFVELVQRLSESEWFSPKSSACGLFHIAYPRSSPATKQKLLFEFKRCCEDPTPMVRRTAATYLKKLALYVEQDCFSQMVENFKTLVGDDQDSVRLLAIENCVAIAERLSEDEKNTIVKPVVLECGKDRSWRVRYMVANCFSQLVDALGRQITQNDLVPVFIKLLRDSEAEVRTAASSKVSCVSKLLNKETVIRDILPCVKLLSVDESATVREALASDIMRLAPLFGREGSNEYLLELFLQLLKDDTAEVRLNIIGQLNEVTQVLVVDQLSQQLLPAIMELAEDRQWRIRSAVQAHIPHLAKQLGVEFFNEKLSSHYSNWLNDCVYTIREAATQNLKSMASIFGLAWAKQVIIPKIKQQSIHPNYLYRTTTLSMVLTLSDIFPPTDIQNDLISYVYTLATDPIPNLRINAAKTINSLIPKLDNSYVQQTIIPFITVKLLTDNDRDVLFFSNVALQTAKKKQ